MPPPAFLQALFPKTAGQKHKKYPRFQVEIGGISLNLLPKVAGGFAFLPYAATLCGTQRTEIRRLEIAFRLLPLDRCIARFRVVSGAGELGLPLLSYLENRVVTL